MLDPEAETRRNIKDAVAGLLNTAEEQGTLVQILKEAGYRLEDGRWREAEIVSTERMQVRVACPQARPRAVVPASYIET